MFCGLTLNSCITIPKTYEIMKNVFKKPTQFIDAIGGQSTDNLEDTKFSNLLDCLHIDKTQNIVLDIRRYIAN